VVRRQRGTVLITVVMMVAIAAIIVTDMTYRQKLDIKRTAALLSRDQAFQYLLSAEELANLALVDDLRQDNNKNDPVFVDSLDEGWSKPSSPFPVAGGAIQGRIFDLQGRFNINSLMASDTKVQQAQRERFQSLLGSLGIPGDATSQLSAASLTDRLVDWMDADQEPTGFDGKEDLDYLGMVPPYRAANAVMWDVSELMLVDGFTASDVAKLAQWVAFLPPDVPLNINTADPVILDAYFSGTTAGLGQKIALAREDGSQAASRHTQGFKDTQSFEEFVAAQGAGGTTTPQQNVQADKTTPEGDNNDQNNQTNNNQQQQGNKLVGNFSVNSEYYLLEAEAVINEKPVLMESILYRPAMEAGTDNSEITIKTLSRKLEDPLKRV